MKSYSNPLLPPFYPSLLHCSAFRRSLYKHYITPSIILYCKISRFRGQETFPRRPPATPQAAAEAAFQEGLRYFNGSGGVARDYGRAARLFREAADQGHAGGEIMLGYCYERGHGVDRDPAEAFRLYERAAVQGHTVAEHNLGCCYRDGAGVGRDYGRAVEMFRRAAAKGDADAISALGECYYNGQGVAQDHAKAVELYREAIAKGSTTGVPEINLGECFELGEGVAKDPAEAKELYRRSAAKGWENAKEKLARPGWA